MQLGGVMYSNIGVPKRLDFTVVGSAVNLAARIEAIYSTIAESSWGVHTLREPSKPCAVAAVFLSSKGSHGG